MCFFQAKREKSTDTVISSTITKIFILTESEDHLKTLQDGSKNSFASSSHVELSLTNHFGKVAGITLDQRNFMTNSGPVTVIFLHFLFKIIVVIEPPAGWWRDQSISQFVHN